MTPRPAPGDPVRVLLRRHRALCECAVDPLEIAAGLEASGITDRTAARCRHRDVFSLAEELYARAPYAGSRAAHTGIAWSAESSETPDSAQNTGSDKKTGDAANAGSAVDSEGADDAGSGAVAGSRPGIRPTAPDAGWPQQSQPGLGQRLFSWCATLVLPLLPGLLCAGTLAWLVVLGGSPPAVRAALCALGAAAVLGSVIVAVRLVPRVPRAVGGPAFPTTLFLSGCWLTGYALYGDWLLEQLLAGGPELLPGGAPRLPSPGLTLGLALAVAPAVWCARGFARAARRRLAGSRSLEEFAAGVRPLLVLAVCTVAVSLPVLQWAAHALVAGPLALSGAPAAPGVPGGDQEAQETWQSAAVGAGALGMLLFAVLLLSAHGFRRAASAGSAVACALQAAALLSVPVARLPGLAVLGRPVEALTAHQAAATVPVVACGCAALVLLAYAAVALAGASAHHREAVPA
ncbi:hypothetical protein ACH4RA_05475 [Streptomyces smyrnaeus]|uniref:hypothetical protein n=1 Tax=Streptomyces TaxID=1883 RepID=UPI0027DAF862|nr:hypothetical protein [Streptomyces sp. B15]